MERRAVLDVEVPDRDEWCFGSGRCGFDIATSTGNYYAKGILVHNCLGLSYAFEGSIRVASRGSFDSEYAQWATQWLHKNNPDATHDILEPEGYTFVFEILYPHRRIVVDNSGNYGLVLLAAVNIETGEEMSRNVLEGLARVYRWPVVPVYPTSTIEQCLDLAKTIKGTEQEGFVAHYPKSGVRVKIKGDDYSKIHRIVTRMNRWQVWQILTGWVEGKLNPPDEFEAATKIAEVAAIIPPEYSKWIETTATELRIAHDELVKTAGRCLLQIHLNRIVERKSQVEFVQKNFKQHFHLVMALLNNQFDRASNMAWKMVEPSGNELPLLQDGEDE